MKVPAAVLISLLAAMAGIDGVGAEERAAKAKPGTARIPRRDAVAPKTAAPATRTFPMGATRRPFLGLFLSVHPTYETSTQTLGSPNADFDIAGPAPMNFGAGLRGSFLGLRFALEANRRSFSVGAADVGVFRVRSGSASFISARFDVARCFYLSGGKAVCPRTGIGRDSIFALGFATNADLDLTSIPDTLLDFGMLIQIPALANGRVFETSLAYRPGLASGSTPQFVWDAHRRIEVGETVRGVLSARSGADWFGGFQFAYAQSRFHSSLDRWDQSSISVGLNFGIQWGWASSSYRFRTGER